MITKQKVCVEIYNLHHIINSAHLKPKKTEFTLISGDLCLLCDLPSESWSHYETAMEILRSCNDWIWLAGNLHFLGFSPKLKPKSKMVDIVTGRNHNSKGEI